MKYGNVNGRQYFQSLTKKSKEVIKEGEEALKNIAEWDAPVTEEGIIVGEDEEALFMDDMDDLDDLDDLEDDE